MSIYITGDVHCPIDVHKLNTKNFPEQKYLTKKDFVIVCGDMGIVWSGDNKDKYWQNWFNDKNFTTLFIDGNHENHDLLNTYTIEEWNGGKVHKIMPNVIHLMRGQVFSINNKKIFTLGGAYSIDKMYRMPHVSWWETEMPSESEYTEAINNLKRNNNKVDLIITHCAPRSIHDKLVMEKRHDDLTNFLEHIIESEVDYSHWYFGHYHRDQNIDKKHTCIYNHVVDIK